MRNLLLGFGPFLDIRENHSGQLMTELAAETPANTQAHILPVEFTGCAVYLPRYIESYAPSHVVLCGIARRTARIELEMVAVNALHSDAPDAAGHSAYDELVVPGGPMAYRSELNLPDWERALNARGIATALSYHAGTYVCNQAYYLACHLMFQRAGRIPVAFIHVPPLAHQVPPALKGISMPYARILEGVRLCLECLRKAAGQSATPENPHQ